MHPLLSGFNGCGSLRLLKPTFISITVDHTHPILLHINTLYQIHISFTMRVSDIDIAKPTQKTKMPRKEIVKS